MRKDVDSSCWLFIWILDMMDEVSIQWGYIEMETEISKYSKLTNYCFRICTSLWTSKSNSGYIHTQILKRDGGASNYINSKVQLFCNFLRVTFTIFEEKNSDLTKNAILIISGIHKTFTVHFDSRSLITLFSIGKRFCIRWIFFLYIYNAQSYYIYRTYDNPN